MSKTILWCAITCFASAWSAAAQTTAWPNKPVRVVVPFAAGGSTDIIARVLTARLTQEFGQQFIVDNRGGAGGSTGAEIVVRANPDGYTFIIVATSYATNAALYKLPYHPINGIAPVGLLHSGPFLLAVNNSVAAANTKEFIDLMRSKSGTLNYGSSGIGGASHLATELFKQMTQTNATHVPYKGDAPAISDLIGGQVQFILSSVPALIQHVKGGRVRALAVTTAQRWPELADLPAVAETVPGYEHTSWNGMWAPAGTPKPIITRLNTTLARLLNLPDVQERLRADGRAYLGGRIRAHHRTRYRQVEQGGEGGKYQSELMAVPRNGAWRLGAKTLTTVSHSDTVHHD